MIHHLVDLLTLQIIFDAFGGRAHALMYGTNDFFMRIFAKSFDV